VPVGGEKKHSNVDAKFSMTRLGVDESILTEKELETANKGGGKRKIKK